MFTFLACGPSSSFRQVKMTGSFTYDLINGGLTFNTKLYLMKAITTTGILSLILFICMSAMPLKQNSTSVLHVKNATTSPSFNFFRTHRQGRGITSDWGLTSNAGVSGFFVRKTYEDPTDPYAEWIDVYSSACGSARSYKCTDNNVSPGYISYQVVALMTDGSTMASDISTERVVSH